MKIIVITSGLTGILNASFELMRRLENDGHEVTCAYPPATGKKVKAQGFDYVEIPPVNFDPAPELPDYQGITRKMKRLIYKWTHRKSRQNAAISALQMNVFAEKMEELKPDLLILDVEMHEYIMTAVARKIPTLLLSQWFSLWERKGLPPLLHDTIPGVGKEGESEAIRIAWQKIKAGRQRTFLKQKLRSGGTNRRTILQKYAAQIGFPERYIQENFWPGPFVYGELPVINMVAEELEFPHDIRPNSFYVGPMVFADRKETHNDPKIDEKLNRIFAEKDTKNKKLIYCSVSTFKSGDTAFLQKVCEAVSGKKDWILVLGLGGKLNEKDLDSLPENVHAFSWIPQLKVLEKVDLSINHGGIHTINECLHFRVPMLIYSGKKSDQNGCAARVHYHGAGIMADKDLDTAADISRKIEEVLTEEKYRQKVEKLQDKADKYRTGKILEKIVSSDLKSK